MQRRSGLGRGLGSLIPSEVRGGENDSELMDVPVALVEPNRYQPREHFDEESLESLTASIRELGVLQPILVRPHEDGFELIAGERRWRAARRAGLQLIPAIVRPVADLASLEQAVVENLHRQDLNALEEASAYQQLVDDFGMTQDQVASRVGRSRSAVANTLRLLQLPPVVQRYVVEGVLSAGHARALLALADDEQRCRMAELIVEDGLSVREAEALCRGGGEDLDDPRANEVEASTAPDPAAPSPRATRLKEPALLELEELLGDFLSTRVNIELGASRGRITVEFADLDDLERIYHQMRADMNRTDV